MQKHRVYYRRAYTRERRSSRRYNGPQAFCQVLAPKLPRGDVIVLDLSPRGACLALPGYVEKGAVIGLILSSHTQLCSRKVMMRVTHCRGPAGAPCIVGGAFTELLPLDVLHTLLG